MIPIEAVDKFLCDENYVSLVESAREQRLLHITDLSETRVSAFLGWLFRPHEGHGLGDHVVRELLHNAWMVAAKPDDEGTKTAGGNSFGGWSPSAIAMRSFRDLLVETEYRFGKSESGIAVNRPADIVLVSRANRLVVVIENKFGTAVHGDQLNAYRRQTEAAFPGYATFLIYLDPNLDNAPDDGSHWIQLGYDWLINLLIARQQSGLLSDMALNALSQVLDYLREDSVTSAQTGQQSRILQLVNDHPAVIREMHEMKALGKHGRLTWNSSSASCGSELLLVEYHQRPKIWDDVLSQSAHAQLIDALHKKVGGDVQVRRLTKRLFFRRRDWVQLTDSLANKDNGWNVRMAAWKPLDDGSFYHVRSAFSFKSIDPAHDELGSTAFAPGLEEALRKVAAELRVGRRGQKNDSDFVRLNEVHDLTPMQAAAWLIQESNRITEALKRYQLLKP